MASSKRIAEAADNEVGNKTPHGDTVLSAGDVLLAEDGFPGDGDLEGTARFDATGEASDMPSWDELVREHGARVYRIAYRLTGNQQDAEDLTQETFIRVFRSLHTYRPGVFEGWLHRIATNLFLDQARRKTKIRMEALPEDYERVPSGAPSPEDVVASADLDPALQSALDNLPPEFRAVVVLCDIEGLSYEEVGASLGVKLGTVRSRLHRARQAIRDSLLAARAREAHHTEPHQDRARQLALAGR